VNATVKLENMFTPAGRFVSGSLTEKQDKDYYNKPIPEDKQRFYYALAVPKTDPAMTDLINAIFNMASQGYAHAPAVMAQINQGLGADKFAWKIEDGDAQRYDDKGQPKETPEYIRGHWIIKFNTSFVVSACNWEYQEIPLSDIKRGDFMEVKFNSQPNGNVDDTAGVYMNPVAIRLLGYGDAIAGGQKASDAFADRQAVLPPGASHTPVGTLAAQQGMPGGAQQPVGQAAMQQPVSHQGMPGAMPQGQPQGMPGAMPQGQPQGMPVGNPQGAPVQQHQAPAHTQPVQSMPAQHGTVSGTEPQAQPHTQILHGNPGAVQPQGQPQGMPGAAGGPSMPGMPGT
jgi:hypothetical protein